MKIEEDSVYTYKDLETILGLSSLKLGSLLREGKLHKIDIDGKVRFLGATLLKDLKVLEKREGR